MKTLVFSMQTLLATGFVLATGLVACTTPRNAPTKLVQDEYSLKSDRSKLDRIRKDIPKDVKEENDELAYVLGLFQQDREPPYRIREKWQREVERRRTRLNREMTALRDTYNREEKKKRDEQTRLQREKREQFSAKKPTAEMRRSFYEEQESQRQDYRSVERENRDDFERDVREKRKDFEDYIRTRQTEFDQQFREYSRRFDEIQRQKREAYSTRPVPSYPAAPAGLPLANPSTVSGNTSGLGQGASTAKDPNAKSVADELKEFDRIPQQGKKVLGTSDAE
jgi:hypothetical protein